MDAGDYPLPINGVDDPRKSKKGLLAYVTIFVVVVNFVLLAMMMSIGCRALAGEKEAGLLVPVSFVAYFISGAVMILSLLFLRQRNPEEFN